MLFQQPPGELGFHGLQVYCPVGHPVESNAGTIVPSGHVDWSDGVTVGQVSGVGAGIGQIGVIVVVAVVPLVVSIPVTAMNAPVDVYPFLWLPGSIIFGVEYIADPVP